MARESRVVRLNSAGLKIAENNRLNGGSMAKGDMFLMVESKRSGVIKGESESSDEKYRGQIDVLGWSWGMKSPNRIGGVGAAGRNALSELRILKMVDSASAPLMTCMDRNDEIKKAVLTVRKAGGEQIDYFTLTIENGRFTSIEVGSPSGPELREELTIAFQHIEVVYSPQANDGSKNAGKTFIADVLTE